MQYNLKLYKKLKCRQREWERVSDTNGSAWQLDSGKYGEQWRRDKQRYWRHKRVTVRQSCGFYLFFYFSIFWFLYWELGICWGRQIWAFFLFCFVIRDMFTWKEFPIFLDFLTFFFLGWEDGFVPLLYQLYFIYLFFFDKFIRVNYKILNYKLKFFWMIWFLNFLLPNSKFWEGWG